MKSIIGEKFVDAVTAEIKSSLEEYSREITDAYYNAGDELTINFVVKLKPRKGKLRAGISINFVKERVKHTVFRDIDENQRQLLEVVNAPNGD